ncbi:MAG: TIGR04013 family B12-binding domain/radical SAM domain-containing protein [Elusimicrobia bacterium]|nr:TIGR04013 family B12-binding domain/radical SAM domain-containing protein [Elusimicrobiota bacterium]
MKSISLIFLYNKFNRYSVNALLGALNVDKSLSDIPVFLSQNFKEISQKIKEKSGLKIVCVSFSTYFSEEIFKEIKKIKKNKNTVFLAGGPHPGACPKETLKEGFDYVFMSEGEKTFTDFIRFILSGKTPKDKIIIPKEKINLDDYPSFSRKHLKFGPIEITRGCPYACRFCQTSYFFGTALRHRSIDNILDQVTAMSKLGLNDIRFITPDALSYGSNCKEIDMKAVENLLKSVRKELPKEGRIFFGTFPGEIRPEKISQQSLDLIKKYCFNRRLAIGAQSASDKILKSCGRGHTFKDIQNALEICLKKGFTPIVDLIFGLPGEIEEDIELNLKFVEKLSKNKCIVHTHYFMPLPGTPWSGKKPSLLPYKLKLKLKHMENEGIAFGKWEKDSRRLKS